MVLILMCLKADFENVEALCLPPTAHYKLTVKNSTGEDIREGVVVSPEELVELTGSKGTANFAMKWVRDAKSQAYLNIQQVKGVTRDLTPDDEGKFVPVVGFECRGLEPVAFHPQGQFVVKGAGGKKVFEEVDMSEGEWVDYDDECGGSVSVMNLEWKFMKA